MHETLRDMRPEDFDALWDLASRWEVVRQLGGFRWPPDADNIRQRCRPYTGEGFVWAICRDDRLIGTVGVTHGDLGYALHPAHHGQGIGARAARIAVDRAFAEGRTVLSASTWHDNPASHRLLRRLGFVHWQTHFAHSVARKRPCLLRRYRLDRADWL